MIALLEAHRVGLYARAHWLPNIVAGVIVGVVALPLAMAFAIASGARPEQGLYTAIIGGGLVSVLGGSRVQIAGPTGAFIAILAGVTAKYGIAGLQVATLMAGIMVSAKGFGGLALSDQIAHFFVAISNHDSFPVVMGVYSAILGLFIPSGGGKWLLEAPYIMQAAIELKVHLGWTVNVYNAAEALPNLINPFWMLPLLGILSLKARDIVGYTFLQLLLHLPVVLFMLWLFALTLEYHPPVFP